MVRVVLALVLVQEGLVVVLARVLAEDLEEGREEPVGALEVQERVLVPGPVLGQAQGRELVREGALEPELAPGLEAADFD